MNTKIEFVYHIIPQKDWLEVKDKNIYHPLSLDSEGFIHCSFDHQIAGVVSRYYSGRNDLNLMKINILDINAPIKIELSGEEGKFPHIYGELNLNAVIGVYPLVRDNANSYSWQEN